MKPQDRLLHLFRLCGLLASAVEEYHEADIDPPMGIEIGRELTLVRAKVEAVAAVASSQVRE